MLSDRICYLFICTLNFRVSERESRRNEIKDVVVVDRSLRCFVEAAFMQIYISSILKGVGEGGRGRDKVWELFGRLPLTLSAR